MIRWVITFLIFAAKHNWEQAMSKNLLNPWCCECTERYTLTHLKKNYCKKHHEQALKVDQVRTIIHGFLVGCGVPDPKGCAEAIAEFVRSGLIAGRDFCFEMLYAALHHTDTICQMMDELTETEFTMMFGKGDEYKKALKKW